MSAQTSDLAQVQTALPAVPLTIEGASVLHQMMRVRWSAWKALAEADRQEILKEAAAALAAMEQGPDGQSALYSLLGHKGDLLFVHFRKNFEQLNDAELRLARLRLFDYLE
ncbi:MAG TPA: chlorite dismutase family protein, partial [Bryobacteraceae bacterium]|nr:chlorite dismutase family protein [Bryobacteraceae bacterium]